MSKLDTADPPSPSFEEEARSTLRQLADALAEVTEAATGQIPGAIDLHRQMGIDRKLGWKVSKVMKATDPFAAVPHVPGATALNIFLDAADKKGASEKTVADVRAAYERFKELIEVHAGDRTSLEMMARGFAEEQSEQDELKVRRGAFEGHSYTWGVQARTQMSANIIMPAETAGKVDVALLSGLVDLRRLRPNVAWVVARTSFVGATAGTRGEPAAPPIPLLEEFCSHPNPQLRSVISPKGYVEVELADGPVGDTGAMTCIFCSDIIRDAGSIYRTETDPNADLNMHVRTPSRVLIHDLIVEHSLFGRLAPTAAVFSEVFNEIENARTRDDRYQLPIPLGVEYLGRGPSILRTPDVPRYPELARHVLTNAGQDPDAYDVYRLQMQYPVVPTSVTMSFDLLPR